MSRLAALAVLSSACLALAGCPGRLTPPTDGGRDAPTPPIDARLDAPGADASVDASGADAPLDDAPSTDDVPTPPTDAPDLDAGTPVDAPMPGDAPMPIDAPMPVDAPIGIDAPPFCGDGVVNGTTEECDLAALGGATCVSLGFTAGTLVCASDCTHDVAGCTRCGNGAIEAGEMCDGANFGTRTCVTEGFTDGMLACGAACTTLVTTGCNRCGDGMRRGAEVCDGADLGSETCATQGFLSGTLGCAVGCSAFVTSMCTNARAPSAAGELLIAEVMPNPTTVGDTLGEWFEIVNRSGALLSLTGCVVSDGGTSMFTITGTLEVAAGGILTFAKSASPGFTPSYVYPSGWDLSNTSDEIRITCGGTEIDRVAYTAAFPWAAGEAMSLDPARITAGANDVASDWCAATGTYGGGATPDLGSPGAANPSCSVTPVENCTNGSDDDGDTLVDCADTADCAAAPTCVPLTIGFCRLHFDVTMSVAASATTPLVYGRVYVAGLTDLSPANDLDPRLLAAVGRGPDGSDPASAAGWVWTAAVPNAAYPGASPEANNDEYQASFTAPAVAGTYDYAYRFSGDGGATWTYCDRNAGAGSDGSQDGYQAANAGALTVTGGAACHLVINEVSVAGGGGGNDEYVEIYNPCSTAIDVTGWRLVYRAAAGTTDTLLATLAGSIPAGTYRLYAGAAYSGPGTVDDSFGGGTGVLAAAGGGVGLRDAAMTRVDSVGYGTATNAFVENTAAVAPASGQSIARIPNGIDTNNNSFDFVGGRTRTPRAAN